MNWNELAEWIASLTDEQRKTDVTVHMEGADEYLPILGTTIADTDVLDEDHPVIRL